jgi:mannose-1-phosphate guanylyltransferase
VKSTKALLLAAGFGTRLKPLTNIWPKCLMPIHGRPLLEYWLENLQELDIDNVLINTHYLPECVGDLIEQSQFKDWIYLTHEKSLLGTAGTIRNNLDFIKDDVLLLAHADNWTHCNFSDFLNYHHNQRPYGTVMTMMTFECQNPESCGIVEINDNGVVIDFHEKVDDPPSRLANAAVYLLDTEVVKWIKDNPTVNDFSTEVIHNFLGKIATWENNNIHRDIGTIQELINAQKDNVNPLLINNNFFLKDTCCSNFKKIMDKYLNE